MTILLDSTVRIDILRERGGRKALLGELVLRGYWLATASIEIGETYSGLLPSERSRAEILFDSMHIYPLTAEIAQNAGELRYAWARRGRTLSLYDMIVAATALEYGLTLMTDNRKDFPIPDLRFFDPP